jgi:hypothetical protein
VVLAAKRRRTGDEAAARSIGALHGLDTVPDVAAEWSFADAWLMISASHFGDNGCDLSELIAAADAYNHSIPTDDEIQHGVGRLMASGLMAESAGRLQLTKTGHALAERARGSTFERAPNLLRLLAQRSCTEGRWTLPPGAVQDAYDRYRARHTP